MGPILLVLTLTALLAIVGTGLWCYRMGYRQAEHDLEIRRREMDHLEELDRLRQLLIRQHGATEWERRLAEETRHEHESGTRAGASGEPADDHRRGGGAVAGDRGRGDDRGQ